MGALGNAVLLMRDDDLRNLVMAGMVYQARMVLGDAANVPNREQRLALANSVLLDPQRHVDQMVRVIACDPDVAVLGDSAEDIAESVILGKVESVWTPFAVLVTPPAV